MKVPRPSISAGFFSLDRAPRALVQVIQNFGWMLASRGLAAVFSLIYLAIITRSLGATGFGRFALITGAAQLLSSMLTFQTWQIIVQFGVGHVEVNDEERLARLYRAALLLDLFSAVAGIVASAIILHFFSDALGLKDTLSRATLVFNTIILLSIRSTALGIMRLRNRFSLAAAADSATPTFRLIGAALVGFIHPTLQGFLIAWAIAEALTSVAHWIGVQRIGEMPLVARKVRNVRDALTENPGIMRYAVTTNFSQSLMVSTRQLPLFLVGGMTGMAAAGAFRLAAQLSRSLTTLSSMIARAAFPEIVRAVRSVGVGGLGAMVMRTVRLALAAGTVVFVLVVLIGERVLELIGGREFGGGYVSLLWLAAAGCIDLVVVTFEPSLAAANRAHLAFIARLAATGLLIAVAVVLEPLMGANGIAAAVFSTSLVQAVLLGAMLWLLVRANTANPRG